MSFKKKLLKGVLHVSTGGTTYLAEKGIKAVKKKLENRKTQKLAKQKQDEIRTKRKKLELEVNEQKKINEARKLSNDNLKKKIPINKKTIPLTNEKNKAEKNKNIVTKIE